MKALMYAKLNTFYEMFTNHSIVYHKYTIDILKNSFDSKIWNVWKWINFRCKVSGKKSIGQQKALIYSLRLLGKHKTRKAH